MQWDAAVSDYGPVNNWRIFQSITKAACFLFSVCFWVKLEREVHCVSMNQIHVWNIHSWIWLLSYLVPVLLFWNMSHWRSQDSDCELTWVICCWIKEHLQFGFLWMCHLPFKLPCALFPGSPGAVWACKLWSRHQSCNWFPLFLLIAFSRVFVSVSTIPWRYKVFWLMNKSNNLVLLTVLF